LIISLFEIEMIGLHVSSCFERNRWTRR